MNEHLSLHFPSVASAYLRVMADFQSLRIVFMGTPEFAVASLEALVKAGCTIVGVVTAPDKPAGRGMQLQYSAVKQFALEKGLPILQPEKLKHPDFLQQLRALHADVQVVVAFRMLPEIVWNMPPLGTVNVHGSLLPRYRGAAPINWAIINGERETGVTTFQLQHAIDTGNILLQESFPIGEDETAGEVHDRMKLIGAQLLVKTLQGLADGSLQGVSQETAIGKQEGCIQPSSSNLQPILPHAPKLFTDTCRIDTCKTVMEVHNLIRGLSPFPGAFTTLQGKMLKLYRSSRQIPGIAADEILVGKPGGDAPSFYTDQQSYLHLDCADGRLSILELQLEGKKRMPVAEFLRGYRFAP